MSTLLLDLDCTITRPLNGFRFPRSAVDQEIIPGMKDKIEEFHRAGYKIYIVSNQGGIEAGYKSVDTTIAQFQYVLSLLPEITCAYFSTEDNFSNKPCFKKQLTRLGFYNNNIYKVTRYTSDKLDFKKQQNRWSFYNRPGKIRFRKPACGMLFTAVDFPNNLQEVVMVGDRWEDEKAAANLGCKYLTPSSFLSTKP